MVSFESVADEYDSARPSYPEGVYEALGNVDGLCVLDVTGRVTIPWTRTISPELWLTDLASHSYVATLEQGARVELVAELTEVLQAAFPSGTMTVPYETWLWTATRIP